MTLSDSDFESTLEKFGVDKEELFTEIKYVTMDEMLEGKHKVRF